MKKITKTTLLVTCLLGLSGQVFAKDFRASGTEPFWDIKLKPLNGDNYRATFSYPGETDVVSVKATVIKSIHRHYDVYQEPNDTGKPLSVMVIKKPCVDDAGGDIWSHVVTVSIKGWTFDGCGGVMTQESKEWSGDNQSNAQPPVNQAREQAKALNTQGFRLYKQGKYYQALPLFKRATEADKNYVLGQYNLACTTSIVMANFECKHDELLEFVDFDLMINSLKQAIKLDPKRRAKSQTDPDLALVRKSFRYYHEILGYSPDNDQQLKAMLVGIDWQTAFRWYHVEPIGQLMFSADGHVTVKTAKMIEGKIPEGSKAWTNSYREGRYRVNNGIVTLIFNSERYGRQQITGQLDNDGVLHFDGATDAKILPADSYQFIKPTPCDNA